MAGRRWVFAGTALVASLPLVLSTVLAALATKPKLAARAFGGEPNPSRHPSDLGLDATEVDDVPGCPAWWIPADDGRASVVIVHGFEPTSDPRATDPAPRLELAALLHDAGYHCFVLSLGYSTGSHLHSGGMLEADDIAAAVAWCKEAAGVPVAVVGFSAGGHAAVTATDRMDAFAVVTDSAFTDFGGVVIAQGSEVLSVPPWLFAPVRRVMKLATGFWPVDLGSWRVDRTIPMMHIHGDADKAIHLSELARMSDATTGDTLVIDGADHLESLLVNRDLYSSTLLAFLAEALAALEGAEGP